jgi:hypothetical protein
MRSACPGQREPLGSVPRNKAMHNNDRTSTVIGSAPNLNIRPLNVRAKNTRKDTPPPPMRRRGRTQNNPKTLLLIRQIRRSGKHCEKRNERTVHGRDDARSFLSGNSGIRLSEHPTTHRRPSAHNRHGEQHLSGDSDSAKTTGGQRLDEYNRGEGKQNRESDDPALHSKPF